MSVRTKGKGEKIETESVKRDKSNKAMIRKRRNELIDDDEKQLRMMYRVK